MQETLESDWTLGAVKRREEERLRSERAAPQGDAEKIQTPHAADVSGDNWVAAAFRRRQEEERAKAASHQSSSGDRADAASREVLVDNWLIEGFKRHQEEERRREIIARSDEAGAPAVGAEERGSACHEAGADDEGSVRVVGALARRPRGASRLIAIAGVAVVGLVSVIGLKTALWSTVESPRGFDRGAPGATQPPKASAARPKKAARPVEKENILPGQGSSPSKETTNAPPTRPAVNGGAPASESAARPGDAAPARPGDAATLSAPPAEAPQNSTQSPAAPRSQPKPEAPSSSAEQGDKSLHENAAAPAASAPAPVTARPKEAVAPAGPDKDSTAKPAAVESERSHEGGRSEPGQNASEPKRQAPNADVDAKPKQQAKEKSGARHSSRKTDGFSGFLNRTANSVRRFFGRLGAKQ